MGRPRLSPARRRHLTGLRLRPARPGDGPACYAVFHAAVHDGTAQAYTEQERAAWAPSPDMPEGWETRLLAGIALLAERRRRPLGFMTLAGDAHLDFAFVHPAVAGMGVGSALHDAILTQSRERGFTVLTTEASLVARPFFRRRGWQEIARQSVIRNGVPLTNFRMELDLT